MIVHTYGSPRGALRLILLVSFLLVPPFALAGAQALPESGDLNPDMKTDVAALEKYKAAIRNLLRQEKFGQLEDIANTARSRKERFSGGGWKLFTFYQGISEQAASLPESEWPQHLSRLNRWASAYPSSVTAQIALAEAYQSHGWKIRGTGFADSVTDEQWQVFHKDLGKAATILDNAAGLTQKCPHWYTVAIAMAVDESWSKQKTRSLLDQSVAFEPDYLYPIRAYLRYLLPMWYGEEGEAGRFADEISNQIGGKKGDAAYFDLAAFLDTNRFLSEESLRKMSWERIKRGYAATEELYGVSMLKLNQFAYLAVEVRDGWVARKTFERIGENFDEKLWEGKANFLQDREWASQFEEPIPVAAKVESGAEPKEIAIARASAKANAESPQGEDYFNRFSQAYMTRNISAFRGCLTQLGADAGGSFDLLFNIAEDGTIQDLKAWPTSKFTECILPKVKSGVYPKPPSPSYWLLAPVPMPSRPVRFEGQTAQ